MGMVTRTLCWPCQHAHTCDIISQNGDGDNTGWLGVPPQMHPNVGVAHLVARAGHTSKKNLITHNAHIIRVTMNCLPKTQK